MKYPTCFFAVIVSLFPFISVAQRQMSVRALDITAQTSLRDFTLLIVHEADTNTLIVSADTPPWPVLLGWHELIIQKAGYQTVSTERWDCSDDTATILVEFRLLKADATQSEVRSGRRHSRKMGMDNSLNPVNMGGFKKLRAGRGCHFTSIVYILSNHGLSTHAIAE